MQYDKIAGRSCKQQASKRQQQAKTGGTASCTNMKHTRKFKGDGYRGISLAYNGDKMRGRLTMTNTHAKWRSGAVSGRQQYELNKHHRHQAGVCLWGQWCWSSVWPATRQANRQTNKQAEPAGELAGCMAGWLAGHCAQGMLDPLTVRMHECRN